MEEFAVILEASANDAAAQCGGDGFGLGVYVQLFVDVLHASKKVTSSVYASTSA